MKRILLSVMLVTLVGFFVVMAPQPADAAGKVTIKHCDPTEIVVYDVDGVTVLEQYGLPAVISVSEKALPAHQGHGAGAWEDETQTTWVEATYLEAMSAGKCAPAN